MRHPTEQTETDVKEDRLLDEVSNLKVDTSMCLGFLSYRIELLQMSLLCTPFIFDNLLQVHASEKECRIDSQGSIC